MKTIESWLYLLCVIFEHTYVISHSFLIVSWIDLSYFCTKKYNFKSDQRAGIHIIGHM